MPTVVHLTASTFFGGPERQMLGLANHLPDARTVFVSFREGGRCDTFLRVVRDHGHPAESLAHDTPWLRAAARELAGRLGELSADVLLCHGYKANLVGRVAGRWANVPTVAVSRGWTGESWKVRIYEAIDRRHLRRMDHVVAVSDGQAEKVRRCGVPDDRITVIRNSARIEAFADPDPAARRALLTLFPTDTGVSQIILAAGRLSPEKGFAVLVDAAALLAAKHPAAGVVLFGDGRERDRLSRQIAAHKLTGRVILAGFTADLDRYIPAADVVCLPSFTEGLPNVALEASAAGVPVVATDVGGIPEVVADGETGWLAPAGDSHVLASLLGDLLAHPADARRMGDAGRRRMRDLFTFAAQATGYRELFDRLARRSLVLA